MRSLVRLVPLAPLSALAIALLHACAATPDVERAAATDPAPAPSSALTMKRLFPTDENPGVEHSECTFASPIAWQEEGATSVLVAEGAGVVSAYHGDTGAERWSVVLPAPAGEQAFATATPALLPEAKLLVVAYHTTAPGTSRHVANARLRQRVAVLDLAGHRLDPRFAPVELEASVPGNGGAVRFLPGNALARGTVVVGKRSGDVFGHAYVTFGNVRDIQPWHGWIFELDLDAWATGGKPVSARRVTTPEADCGAPGESGSRTRVCGGGLWAPSGPLLRPRGDDYELILPPGNGQLDLRAGDYANTLMRTGRGLPFDPGCDTALCAVGDPRAPTEACAASCRHLFVPRIPPGGPAFVPENGYCDGVASFFDCWAKLDFVGGSTPALARLRSGKEVLVYPPKDGHAYLVDADHLGTLLDRLKLVDNCGTKDDPCRADWAGMAVTQPEILDDDDGPLALIPTFVFDRTHGAGVFALRVRETSAGPRLEKAWQFPRADVENPTLFFRRHPMRPLLMRDGPRGEPILWVAELVENEPGILWGLRATDGELLVRQPLAGRGMRFARPIAAGRTLYLPSCQSDTGTGRLEGYRLEP